MQNDNNKRIEIAIKKINDQNRILLVQDY